MRTIRALDFAKSLHHYNIASTQRAAQWTQSQEWYRDLISHTKVRGYQRRGGEGGSLERWKGLNRIETQEHRL